MSCSGSVCVTRRNLPLAAAAAADACGLDMTMSVPLWMEYLRTEYLYAAGRYLFSHGSVVTIC